MDEERKRQLKWCKLCEHRVPNFREGLQCGLTGKIADFGDECPDFQEEPGRRDEVYKNDMALTGDIVSGDSKDYQTNIILGIIGLVAGPAVFIFTLLGSLKSGGIFLAPIGLMIGGGLMLKRGLDQKKVHEAHLHDKAEAEAREQRKRKSEQ